MLLASEHTLGLNGIGPRTFHDSYEIALFDYQTMALLIATRYSDYGDVSDYLMSCYREDRETYFAVRSMYLGV